jgi:TetR/AcrR family transcriptional regulator
MRREEVAGDDLNASANLMLALVEGLMHQYLRSRFEISPLAQWEAQWRVLEARLFSD